MFIIILVWRQGAAPTQIKLPANEGKGISQSAGIWEWAEIPGPIVLLETCEAKPGNGIVEIEFEQEETLVIPETNVVAGMKLLNELAFKEERFGVAFNDMYVQIVNCLDQRIELQIPPKPARGMKVLSDAFAQIARFADVNDRSESVLHEVNAWPVRQITELLFYEVVHRHLRISQISP
jgi:hypothetical protein